MTNEAGPNLVHSGLKLYLDAANFRSYPSTGTTWTDLSNNQNNGTLVNSPTYNSGNNGSIVFDGNNQYVDCGTTTPPSGDISVFAWVYPTSFMSTWNVIVTKWFLPAANDFHWSLKSNLSNGTNVRQNLFTTSNSDIYGTSVFSINNWYYIGFTLVNGGLLTFYNNGNQDGTSSAVSRTVQNSSLLINDHRSIWYGFAGKISNVVIYNRALLATEVLQNYNATKGRYGL